jgi:hypothetical protein
MLCDDVQLYESGQKKRSSTNRSLSFVEDVFSISGRISTYYACYFNILGLAGKCLMDAIVVELKKELEPTR